MGPVGLAERGGQTQYVYEQASIQLRAGWVFVDLVEREESQIAHRLKRLPRRRVLLLRQRARVERVHIREHQ